jgi:post-segregation antitoxin (ccd killing protein)
MGSKPRMKRICVSIHKDSLPSEARKHGLNISATCEAAIGNALMKIKAEANAAKQIASTIAPSKVDE